MGDTYGDQANTFDGYAGSYTLSDAAVHYDLGKLDNSLKGASVAVNASNLFNKDYIATVGVLNVADANALVLYPGSPVSVYTGLRFSF